jgi:glycosyltransferase involved in cell wall biosynthesis
LAQILFVSPYYVPFVGGTTAFIEAMSRRLVASGIRAIVLTTTARRAADFWQPPIEPLLPPKEILDGVEVVRVSVNYPRPAPYAFGLLRRAGHWLHRSELPAAVQRPLLHRLARAMPSLSGLEAALAHLAPTVDLIQAEDSSWDGLFTQAAAAARCYDKPFAARPLMHLGDAGVRTHFQMAHQVDAYRSASAVLALSQREAAEYVALGICSDRVHVIPMGVDDEAFTVSEAVSPVAFLREHTCTDPLVVFLGANTYDKGAFALALAAAELNRTDVPVTVVYAGPQSESLTTFLARQPAEVRTALRGRIRILGVVDEATKHQLLAACDMLALPSQVDTFGIVLLEAGLHSKPVIGATAGGIPEVIRDGQTGLLVPFGDVAALAGAIRRLVEAPEWARRLGQTGRELVLREYTWDRTYRELKRIYADVLS